MIARATTWKIAGAFALATVAQACGGGLSYTVDEDEVRSLSGEHAERIEASRSAVNGAEQAVSQAKREQADSEKAVEAAERKKETAIRAVDGAESQLEKNASAYERAVEQAKEKRDRAIAAAREAYEADVQAAKDRRADVDATGKAALTTAKDERSVEQAREAYEKALLAEREARVELAEAELWVTRAKLELTKFDELQKARGTGDTVEAGQERLDFVGQANERERTALEKKKTLEQREDATRKAKAALERLEPPPAGADQPKASGGD